MNNHQMSLEKISNPMVRKTAEFLVEKINDAPDDESYNLAKSALLIYLNTAAPETLKNSEAVSAAVAKLSPEVVEEVPKADAHKLLKEALAEKGIYYFGNLDLDKHLATGPHWVHPLPNPPHGEHQDVHGRRGIGARRNDVEHLLAYKKLNPLKGEAISPHRGELMDLTDDELHALVSSTIGDAWYSGSGQVSRTSVDEEGGDSRRKAVDQSGGWRMRGAGGGKNPTADDAVRNILDMAEAGVLGARNDKIRVLTERPRKPGTDMVDWEAGHTADGTELPSSRTRTANEHQLTTEAEAPGTGGLRRSFGTKPRSGSLENHPEFAGRGTGVTVDNGLPAPKHGPKDIAADLAGIKERAAEILGDSPDNRAAPDAQEAKPRPETTSSGRKGPAPAPMGEGPKDVVHSVDDLSVGSRENFDNLNDEAQATIKAMLDSKPDGVPQGKLSEALRLMSQHPSYQRGEPAETADAPSVAEVASEVADAPDAPAEEAPAEATAPSDGEPPFVKPKGVSGLSLRGRSTQSLREDSKAAFARAAAKDQKRAGRIAEAMARPRPTGAAPSVAEATPKTQDENALPNAINDYFKYKKERKAAEKAGTDPSAAQAKEDAARERIRSAAAAVGATPDKMPEAPDNYFTSGDVKTESIPVSDLVPTKDPSSQPDALMVAAAAMHNANAGLADKRAPVRAYKRPDGKYQVVDGNATYGVASASKWDNLPVEVIPAPAEANPVDHAPEADNSSVAPESAPKAYGPGGPPQVLKPISQEDMAADQKSKDTQDSKRIEAGKDINVGDVVEYHPTYGGSPTRVRVTGKTADGHLEYEAPALGGKKQTKILDPLTQRPKKTDKPAMGDVPNAVQAGAAPEAAPEAAPTSTIDPESDGEMVDGTLQTGDRVIRAQNDLGTEVPVSGTGYASDIGGYKKSSGNQDAAIAGTAMNGVSDGIGGAEKGHIASAVAARVMLSHEANIVNAPDTESAKKAMQTAIDEARTAVAKEAGRGGATLNVSVMRPDGTVIMGHVGDSSALLVGPDGSVKKLVKEQGVLNIVHNFLGRGHQPGLHEADEVIAFKPEAGSHVISTSDGVTDYLTNEQIAEVVKGSNSPQEAAQKLIEMARSDKTGQAPPHSAPGNPSHDNVTASVFKVGDVVSNSPDASPTAENHKKAAEFNVKKAEAEKLLAEMKACNDGVEKSMSRELLIKAGCSVAEYRDKQKKLAATIASMEDLISSIGGSPEMESMLSELKAQADAIPKSVGGKPARIQAPPEGDAIPAEAPASKVPSNDPLRETRVSKQLPGEGFPLDDEKQSVVESVADGKNLAIHAFAGTGKTTILEAVARRNPDKKILYAVFNKRNAKEAKGKFPKNTTVGTANQLSYRESTPQAQKRALRNGGLGTKAFAAIGKLGNFDTNPITIELDDGTEKKLKYKAAGALMRKTIDNFTNSAEDNLELKHVPYDIPWKHKQRMLDESKKYWAELGPNGSAKQDFGDSFKLWALGKPDLSHHDIIMFDEAQDASPVMAKVIQDQMDNGAQVIAVGDPNQAIYGWRGAVDSLKDWKSDENLPLTTTYRSGPAVVDIANRFLQYRGQKNRMKPNPGVTDSIGPIDNPDAVITRTNAGAFSEAVKQLDNGRKVALVGGNKPFLNLADDYDLLNKPGGVKYGDRVKNPDLWPYKDWHEVQQALKDKMLEGKTASLAKVIDSEGSARVREVAAKMVDPNETDDYDVVVGNTHMAKGLEWDNVEIGEDFPQPKEDPDTGEMTFPDDEQIKLAYVAVTRAKKKLDPGPLSWIMNYTDPNGAGESRAPEKIGSKAKESAAKRKKLGEAIGAGKTVHGKPVKKSIELAKFSDRLEKMRGRN